MRRDLVGVQVRAVERTRREAHPLLEHGQGRAREAALAAVPVLGGHRGVASELLRVLVRELVRRRELSGPSRRRVATQPTQAVASWQANFTGTCRPAATLKPRRTMPQAAHTARRGPRPDGLPAAGLFKVTAITAGRGLLYIVRG